MTIRHRTVRAAPATSRIAGATAATGLLGAGALHVAWALGSSWPATDPDDLTDLVVGRRPTGSAPGDGTRRDRAMPGSVETFAVAGLLGAGAVLAAGASGVIPLPGRRAERLARLGTRVAAGVLLARGSGGLAVSALELVPTSERFRRWNLRLYSPLCLVLGGAAALSTRER